MLKTVVVALAAAFALSIPAAAEAPKPFPEFEAKRIKVPSKGSAKRITVQIAPDSNWRRVPGKGDAEPPVAASVRVHRQKPETPKAPRYAWFWDQVSPEIAVASPGRLEAALTKLSVGGGGNRVNSPRLQDLQDIAAVQGIEILKATIGTQVSPALALAVISVESGGRVDAISGAGARGLMQLMPATAERFGVNDSFSPSQNIRGGVAYLDFLMKKFDGDPILALAGYNAGENAVTKHGGVPPYPETRDYVPKVLAAFSVARGLCKTPPELASDGCVFAVSARN